MIEGLDHVAVAVADLEKSETFYREALGFQVFTQREVDHPQIKKVVFLRRGDDTIELLHMPGLTPAQGASSPIGLAHICFQVRGVSAEIDRWLGLGIPQLVPATPLPDGNIRTVFQGPSGEQIELRGS